MSRTVLLTGATGFLGMEVLARLLERDDVEVLALVRGRDADEARTRLDGVLDTLYDTRPPGAAERVRAVPGDMIANGLGLSDADRRDVLSRVDSVLHCAASISFDLPLDEARDINSTGTMRVLDIARELDSLKRVVHVSTAYVSGRHVGRFGESDLDVGQEFRNTYERSKYETELMLRAEAGDLPLAIARPSIVVGESVTGWTPAFNVIYWPLQAFDRGLFDRIPASPDGRVDIVPVDYVADALVHLLDHDEVRDTLNLVAGDGAATNEQVLNMAAQHLGRPRPRLVDPGETPELEEAEVYIPYFDVRTEFDDRRAQEVLAPHGIRAPALDAYFGPLLDYARTARWGRRSVTREGAASALSAA